MRPPRTLTPQPAGSIPSALSATETIAAIHAGTLTSAHLVAACLERIELREPTVQAWASLQSSEAILRLAAEMDNERRRGQLRGPLHGVPLGIKDVIDTEDLPTQYGSPIYQGNRPARDADCVSRLRAAGAIIIGKTVTCEFANYPPSRTRNPHDIGRTPGGSSSGSAAAVADAHVTVALGTQTAGSIIRPAAFNGVIGFKPTYASYDRSGVLPLAPSFDTVGLLARHLGDVRLIHGILNTRGIHSEAVVTADNVPPRIGVVRTPWWLRGELTMREGLLATAKQCRAAGASIVDIDLPDEFVEVLNAHEAIFSGEGVRSFSREMKEHPELIHPQMRDRLLIPGLRISAGDLDRAQKLLDSWRLRLVDIARDVDVLLTPAATGEAPEGLGQTGDPIFNRVWTALHVPCLAYPIGVGNSGMPLAVQVVGRAGGDEALLAHAAWMMRHSGADCAVGARSFDRD